MSVPPSSSAPPRPGADPAGGAAKTWTILEVLKWTQGRFAERGLPTPRLDAELLAAHAFGMKRIALYAHFDRPLQPPELTAYRELVKRRLAGEPVAYLTGKKEFWSLELSVDPRVLIPRPDTETAVETVLDLVRPPRAEAAGQAAPLPTGADDGDARAETEPPTAAVTAASAPAQPAARPLRIADIGTGSGAIALALKKELPTAEVVAVDLSPDALDVARTNAERLNLAIELVAGDLLTPLAARAPFDVIVANLPYVKRDDIAQLAPEVRTEPVLALDGGADGLDLVRRLVAGARAHLVPGGALVLEIGIGQSAATAAICADAGFVAVGTRRDLDQVERVVHARAPGAQ